MPTTSHRVVGVVDVDAFPELALQLDAPLRRAPEFGCDQSRVVSLVTTTDVVADVQQLAIDLIIELERFQRQSIVDRPAPTCVA